MSAVVVAAAALACSAPAAVSPDAASPDAASPDTNVVDAPPPQARNRPTYHEDVAPILHRSCAGCHSTGGIAPFPLTTFAAAKPRGPAMLEAVEAGHMPPWGARTTPECAPRLPWKDDVRLTDAEKATLAAWVAAEMPEGDAERAAQLPAVTDTALQNANTHVAIPKPVAVSGDDDQYLCFSLDPQIAHDVWLTGTQIVAGNSAIVHHVLLYSDPDGQSAQRAAANGHYPCFGGPGISGRSDLLGAWAPGAVPAITPPDVGIPFKAGSRIIMNVHYHPTGHGVEHDAATAVQLRWTTRPPAYEGRLALIGNFAAADTAAAGGPGFGLLPGPGDRDGKAEFRIPAGSTAHTETMRFLIPGGARAQAAGVEMRLWAVGAHMHYLGSDMKIDLISRDKPGAGNECLLQTPHWDFDWQRAYTYAGRLDEVPTLRPGDELMLRCTYDNSWKNPAMRHALADHDKSEPKDVTLGEGTLDEMCLGVFGIAVPQPFAKYF